MQHDLSGKEMFSLLEGEAINVPIHIRKMTRGNAVIIDTLIRCVPGKYACGYYMYRPLQHNLRKYVEEVVAED